MNGPADLWTALLAQKVDTQKASSRRHDYTRKVLDLLANNHPDLYSGKPCAKLSVDELQSIVAMLKKNSPGHIFKHRMSFLIRVLEQGTQELCWDVAIPAPPVVIPRDRPRFTHESFAKLPELYKVEAAFLEDLKEAPPPTYTSRIGQLLLSAVLFGGLIQKRWLAPWIGALSKIRSTESLLWLDMLLKPEHLERERRASGKTGRSKPDHSSTTATWEIRRRWFADPLTHALILRWHTHFPEDLSAKHDASPLLAIRHYLDRIPLKPGINSKSFVLSLLNNSATRLGLEVTPFLTAYAEGRNKSVSLSPMAWERLLTGKCVIGTKECLHTNEVAIPLTEPLAVPKPGKVASPATQEKLLKEVFKKILPLDTNRKRKKSESREALRLFYEENRENLCQALACLILWSIDLLTHFAQHELIRGRVKGSIQPSSVKTYIDAIGKRLISVTGHLEILDLESDELHDLYSEVIDISPTKKAKHRVGARLAAFHQFLMVRFGAPSVDFSDLSVHSGPAELGVDANLLSFSSFDQLKKVLCPSYTKASRLRKIQLLIAIIGFRCGLRRGEVIKLRLIDLQGEAEPELLVRTNRYAYVKSSNSVRRLPLSSLLEKDELDLLISWRRERKHEDDKANTDSLIFCMQKQETILLNEHDVFPEIEQAMRQVTGDSSLRFHHFRHSFASWLLLRLLRDFSEETRRRNHFLFHPLFDPDKCHELRKSLLGNLHLGRQALFAVAQLCGHASPEVTLLHYVHLCDWLLGHETTATDNQPELDAATIQIISGLQQHTLYYDMSKQAEKSWNISAFIGRIAKPETLESRFKLQKPDVRAIPEKVSDHPDSTIPLWRRVKAVLHERQMGKLPYGELARRSGLTEHEIVKWCENANLIVAMKTLRGKPRHVNGVTLKNNPSFLFPLPLHLKVDKEMVEKVINLYESSSRGTRRTLDQGVKLFIKSFYVSGNGLKFSVDRDALKYVRFLKLLGIPQNRIRIECVLPRIAGLSHEEESKSLVNKLKLPAECIFVRDLLPREHSSAKELFVLVINPPIGPKETIKASYGFRFAIYMIGIIHSLVQDPHLLLE
jgi:integrase